MQQQPSLKRNNNESSSNHENPNNKKKLKASSSEQANLPTELVVGDLDQGRIKQINRLISASIVMKFMGKSELAHQVLPILLYRIDINEQGNKALTATNTLRIPTILYCVGSPGIGKTRNAFEVIESVKEDITSVEDDCKLLQTFMKTKVELYLQLESAGISFGNYKCDNNNSNTTYNTLNRMLAIRMCYIFNQYYICNNIPFNEHNWNSIQSITQFGLYLKQLLKVDKLTLVIVIDDFQYLNRFRQLDKSCIDIVINIVGCAISELAHHNILFIPIFSGRGRSTIKNSIRKSNYIPYAIQPTRSKLSFNDISEFIDEFIEKLPQQAKQFNMTHENWMELSILRQQIKQCYGIPRRVEHLLINLCCLTSWEQCCNCPYQTHSIDIPNRIRDQLMAYYLTEFPIKSIMSIDGILVDIEQYDYYYNLIPLYDDELFKLEPLFPLVQLSYRESIFYTFATLYDITSSTTIKDTEWKGFCVLGQCHTNYIKAKRDAIIVLNI